MTVIWPTIPACRWASTEQKNVYVPGLSVTLSVEVPPLETTGPLWLSPLPWMEMSCGTEDLLGDWMVTGPGLAWAFLKV